MEKSLVLVLPDRPGALCEVMAFLAENDVDVLRASYNHVTDSHTVFIDVSGTIHELEALEEGLHERRLFPDERSFGELRLLDLNLKDRVGSTVEVLRLLVGLASTSSSSTSPTTTRGTTACGWGSASRDRRCSTR